MKKELTFWVWLREIVLFLLMWPIFLVILIDKLFEPYNPDVTLKSIILWLYLILGWYPPYRIYRTRMKDYVFPKNDKPYSILKEIGLFILIWPIVPIFFMLIDQAISSLFQTTFPSFDIIVAGLMLVGWVLALVLFLFRRKSYLGFIFADKNLDKKF